MTQERGCTPGKELHPRQKVLIVEDEIDLLDLIDFNLTREGFRTLGVMDGRSAMEKIDLFCPNLIVLDLMLPEIDGWEICRQVRERYDDIAILILTAKCAPEDRSKGLEAGADYYMTKPFGVKDLVARVKILLERKYTPSQEHNTAVIIP